MLRKDYLKLPLKERFLELSKSEDEHATELHEKLISVDIHSHIIRNFDRQRVKNSSVTCFFEAVAVVDEIFEESMKKLGFALHFIQLQPDMDLGFCAEDIRDAKVTGKQVVMMQLEPQTVGLQLDRVDALYGLGVRMMLLTYNSRNYIGDGCGERTNSGLSCYGLQVVERMNKVGMLIDLSHCGDRTTSEAIEASKDPVLISHSGARALNPQCMRLRTDEHIEAVAEKDGLIGISAAPNQLSSSNRQGIQDLLNHVDYVVKLAGINHVAIGLDNELNIDAYYQEATQEGKFRLPAVGQGKNAEYMEGIESPEEWPNITRGLVSRGYSDQEIEKIIGGNALRIIGSIIG